MSDRKSNFGSLRPRHTSATRWVGLLIYGAALAVALFSDPYVAAMTVRANEKIRGDLRREMEFIQQFGAITSAVLIAAVVWTIDPANRRRLPAAVLGCAASALSVFILKCLIGRPRPRLGQPWKFVPPWETYLLDGWTTPRHAWQFWERGMSVLWSMPSGHTAAAFALARVLTNLYPQLRAIVVTLAVLVAICRVVLGAHYPSDVIVGAGLGWVIAGTVQRFAHRRLNPADLIH